VTFFIGLWLFRLVEKYDLELSEVSAWSKIFSSFILAIIWPILAVIFLISLLTSKNK
jgi:hypothetical protein